MGLLPPPHSGGGLFPKKLPSNNPGSWRRIHSRSGELEQKGVPLTPVTTSTETTGIAKLLEQNPPQPIANSNDPTAFVVFYGEIEYSATAYFYLDSPSQDLSPLPGKQARIAGLPAKYQ